MEKNLSVLKGIRRKVRYKLKTYADKHYDARPILKLYDELCDVIGDRSNLDYTTHKYWDSTFNRDRQEYNQHPIIGYKGSPENGYQYIYKDEDPKGIRPHNENKKIENNKPTETHKSDVINVAINDYIISVCGNIEKYPKIREALGDLGLKYTEDNPNKLSCRISDTEEGYNRLKRSLVIILDLISSQSFEIGIMGHKV